MIKIGFSLYTGLKDYSASSNKAYLLKCVEKGYEVMFTSAHISEAENNYKNLTDLVNFASDNGIKTIIDVSKPMMDKFSIPDKTFALRLDYGFTKQEIVEYSKNHLHKVELNASTMSENEFNNLISLGLDLSNVRVSFNFYPKLYTGHSISFVKKRIEYFHQFNIPVLAFIPSHYGFRPPMYEGLPTVEKHRTMTVGQAIEELKSVGIDEIAFGDAYASCEELEILKKHQCEHLIIPLKLQKGTNQFVSYLNETFRIRPDYNDLLLRLSSTRSNDNVESYNTTSRNFGDVTIDNNLFLRYKGEINIVLSALPKDKRVNVIGNAELLENVVRALKRGQKFTFEIE